MKVLFSGDFSGSTEQSELSIAYARALSILDSELELKLSPLVTNEIPGDLESFVGTCESDIRIYGETPDLYPSSRHEHAVGLFTWNTDKLPNNNYGANSDWVFRLNFLDLILVPSAFTEDTLCSSGVYTPIKIVPFPVEISTTPKVDLYDPSRRPLHSGWFKFITYLELDGSYDYKSLFLSYLTAFSTEHVALIIHTRSEKEAIGLQKALKDLKTSLHLRNQSPRVFFVPSTINEESAKVLYKSCDCFVTTSKGSGTASHVIQALGAGLPVIAPSGSSFKDIINEERGFLVEVAEEPVYNTSYKWNYSDQNWHRVNIQDLQRKLNEAQKYRTSLANKSKAALQSVHSHTPKGTAIKILETLEDLLARADCKEPALAATSN